MKKIRKGDEVAVIAGKDKGRRGTVLKVFPENRVLVEGINIAKKHEKPNPNMGVAGGIVDREMPLHISNVAHFNTKTKKSDRIANRISDNGSNERIFRSTGETVDI